MSLVSAFPGLSHGLSPATSPAIHFPSHPSPCPAAHNRLAPAIYSSTKAKNAPTTRPRSALDRGAPPKITDGVAECVGLLAVVAGGIDVGPTDGGTTDGGTTDGGTDPDGAKDPETTAREPCLVHAQTRHGLVSKSVSLSTEIGCLATHQTQRHR